MGKKESEYLLEILAAIKRYLKVAVCCYLILLMVSCSSEDRLSPFSSDGCSLFPDASLINETDWCDCCFQHDVAYWKGGAEQERLAADQQLKQCVLQTSNDRVLANIMYEGVRFGGSPYFYNWYRWGYGWNYDRKYQPLNPSEQKQVDLQLAKYFTSVNEPTCKK